MRLAAIILAVFALCAGAAQAATKDKRKAASTSQSAQGTAANSNSSGQRATNAPKTGAATPNPHYRYDPVGKD
jgi:hypothetical protein